MTLAWEAFLRLQPCPPPRSSSLTRRPKSLSPQQPESARPLANTMGVISISSPTGSNRKNVKKLETPPQDTPGCPGVKITLPMEGVWVQSLVRELRSHMLQGEVKYINTHYRSSLWLMQSPQGRKSLELVHSLCPLLLFGGAVWGPYWTVSSWGQTL